MSGPLPRLSAVIGVWADGGRTYYVKRSAQMKNYPGGLESVLNSI